MTPVSPREGAETAKRLAVQADVLRATEELLAQGSTYADLNVEKIATAAGISRTAFYFYFRDKRDLLMRLAGHIVEELFVQADRWFSIADDEDPEPAMRDALAGIGRLYAEHGPLLRAIVEVSTYDEEIATFWRGLLGKFVEATQARLEQAQADMPEDDRLPAHATAFALVWMAERTFYQQFVQSDVMTLDEALEALTGIFRRATYGR